VASDDLLIERLLRVIDEGRRTATYKLALLLGIIDASATLPDEVALPTRLVADRVLALYYPQTRAFVDATGTARVPRQITNKTSTVLAAVERLHVVADEHRLRTVAEVGSRLPIEYGAALEAVEDTLVRYPIPLMQTVGATSMPFLYEVDWPEGTSVTSLRRSGGERLRLMEGVPGRLAVLGPMLRPLIELHWTRDVAKWTGVALEDEALRTHLFGAERVTFPRSLVADLSDLQSGECFYCASKLGSRREVDHFLAWSRSHDDAIQNLVIADRCNGWKSDHLAAEEHLVRWRARLEYSAAELAAIATKRRWDSSPMATWGRARTVYSHLAPNVPLWLREREFEFAPGPLPTLPILTLDALHGSAGSK
jgi:hypothetical protein